jgi:hypothetical protein
MAASESLRRELESIEGEVESLRDGLYRLEDLRAARIRPGWLKVLGMRMLKVDLRRRIRDLGERRRVALNCYAEARKYENWLERAEREERWESAAQ